MINNMEDTKKIEFPLDTQRGLLREVLDESKELKDNREPTRGVIVIPNTIMDQVEILKYSLRIGNEKVTKKNLVAAILKVFLEKVSGATKKEIHKLISGEEEKPEKQS